MLTKPKTIIGWGEWCSLPNLELPAINAKIDTGAKTSALHAYDMNLETINGIDFVRFKIHPLQKDHKYFKTCQAPLKEIRTVTSSNGEREKRYVIETEILLGDANITAEVTLTSRHEMAFRMLLGRDTLKKAKVLINPRKSYILGKIKDAESYYF